MMFLFATAFADPLPDMASTVTRAECESPRSSHGGRHPGAEQFYTGAFRVKDDGSFEGVERRYTYANSTWKKKGGDLGGDDCVDVWTVTGTKKGATLDITADIDPNLTTCTAQRLTANGNHFRTTYSIREKADGSIELFFKSGKSFATGKRTDQTYSWKSGQTCVWF